MKTYKTRPFEVQAVELRETTRHPNGQLGEPGDFLVKLGGYSHIVPRPIFLVLYEPV